LAVTAITLQDVLPQRWSRLKHHLLKQLCLPESLPSAEIADEDDVCAVGALIVSALQIEPSAANGLKAPSQMMVD
jgi:hypothetical protein